MPAGNVKGAGGKRESFEKNRDCQKPCHCEPVLQHWCGNPPVFLGATYHACHCEPVLTLAWQSVTPAFPWGKVARASPASARRMRATCLSPWERCPAGVERACLPSQSLRDSSPRVGAKGRTDCDRRESLKRATPVCGSSQRNAFFASALKTERYRAGTQ